MSADDDEYVELLLTVENGQVVSCEYHGEGKQAVPLIGPVVMQVLPAEPHNNEQANRFAQSVVSALAKL